MNRINAGRVIPGGAAGAAIVFIVAGLLPGITLDSDLKVWHQSTNNLYTHPSRSVATVFFALMSLLFGLTGTWIYAGIRPRYGPGPKTAVLAGVLVWLSGWLTAALGHMALGDYPQTKLVIVPCMWGFIGAILATLAGAAIYKE